MCFFVLCHVNQHWFNKVLGPVTKLGLPVTLTVHPYGDSAFGCADLSLMMITGFYSLSRYKTVFLADNERKVLDQSSFFSGTENGEKPRARRLGKDI